ncbi:helix-turn-helix transcriptional regulator [Bacteroidota bacterium]
MIIVAIVLSGLVTLFKVKEDFYIDAIIDDTGSCYLDDGTCLHDDRDMTLYIIGWILSGALLIMGMYVMIFDKTQRVLAEHQLKVSGALKEYAEKESTKGKFEAFLAGFNNDEQLILKAIHEQEGITQSTLRYRTGISKTSLSLILKSFEDREIVSRKKSGKTNEVFLRKKF